MKWNTWTRLGAHLLSGFALGALLGIASEYARGGRDFARFVGYFGTELAILAGIVWMVGEMGSRIKLNTWTRLVAHVLSGFALGAALGIASAYAHHSSAFARFASYFGRQLAILAGIVWMVGEIVRAFKKKKSTRTLSGPTSSMNGRQMKAISITFNPSKGDILRAAYVGLRSRPVSFAVSIGFFGVIPWLIALGHIAASALGESKFKPWSTVFLITTPLLFWVPIMMGTLSQFRGARSLQGPHLYEFSDDEIRLKGSGFENHVAWTLLTRCYGSKHGLLFISGKLPLIFVPGHSLAPLMKTELRRLLVGKNIQLTGQWKTEHDGPNS